MLSATLANAAVTYDDASAGNVDKVTSKSGPLSLQDPAVQGRRRDVQQQASNGQPKRLVLLRRQLSEPQQDQRNKAAPTSAARGSARRTSATARPVASPGFLPQRFTNAVILGAQVNGVDLPITRPPDRQLQGASQDRRRRRLAALSARDLAPYPRCCDRPH
jgi:hypothetical protein